ncbi:MAG: transcription termination/antitermination protein NusG [Pirellulaceae bacterium]
MSDELQSSAASPDEPGKRTDESSSDAQELRSAETSTQDDMATQDDASTPDDSQLQASPNPREESQPLEDAAHEDAAQASPAVEDESADAGNDDDADDADADDDYEDDEYDGDVEPLELIEEAPEEEEIATDWYILKVQVNRENTICDALWRRVKVAGLERYFNKIIVPTEEVQEFTKTGKKRIVKKKLYPGYIMVNMAINDDSWFLVRETPGIGDFTGSAGKPTPMQQHEIAAILIKTEPENKEEAQIRSVIKVKPGDRVRVKEGYFQNFEGQIDAVDEANGRVTVIITIFNRSTPVELEHWQVEEV